MVASPKVAAGSRPGRAFGRNKQVKRKEGCTVPAPASFGSDTDVFETEDVSGERTRFSVSVGDSTADSYSLDSVDKAQDDLSGAVDSLDSAWSDWRELKQPPLMYDISFI